MNRVALEAARKSVEIEEAGVAKLRAALDGPLGDALEQAIATIKAARGKVIVSGMGKSGHIGRKSPRRLPRPERRRFSASRPKRATAISAW